MPPSGIRRYFDIAATMDNVISLGIGDPDMPTPEPIIEPDDPLDAITLVLGSGAVLLGVTLVAVYVVRRP